jgi:hypothetical protein
MTKLPPQFPSLPHPKGEVEISGLTSSLKLSTYPPNLSSVLTLIASVTWSIGFGFDFDSFMLSYVNQFLF